MEGDMSRSRMYVTGEVSVTYECPDLGERTRSFSLEEWQQSTEQEPGLFVESSSVFVVHFNCECGRNHTLTL